MMSAKIPKEKKKLMLDQMLIMMDNQMMNRP